MTADLHKTDVLAIWSYFKGLKTCLIVKLSWMYPLTYLSSLVLLRTHSPVRPGKSIWSRIIMMSPTLKSGFNPPAALVRNNVLTPSNFITRMGIVV